MCEASVTSLCFHLSVLEELKDEIHMQWLVYYVSAAGVMERAYRDLVCNTNRSRLNHRLLGSHVK